MTQTINLTNILMERAAAITRLKRCGLSLDWLKEYSIPCLLDCCSRKEQALPDNSIYDAALQRELIQNPRFASWYAKLLPMLPDDLSPEQKPAPTPAYRGRSSYYQPSPRPEPPSRRVTLQTELKSLLEACNLHGKDITGYGQDTVLGILEQEQLTSYARLVFLENFASEELSEDTKQTVIANLRNCSDLPLELDERENALLVEPFVATRHLFNSAPFQDIHELLDSTPELLDIVRLLHENQIQEELNLADYKAFAQDVSEYSRLLESLVSRIGPDAAADFIQLWKRSECPLYELRTIESQVREHPELDWTEQLSTYAGYVNQLYGKRFKRFDPTAVYSYLEGILIYAIVHNKKHFIKLVDDNPDLFLGLPIRSILIQEEFYREHFNLNELTEKDLRDCAWMMQQNLKALAPGRRYTFQELRALYDTSKPYASLYHALQSDSQDYRLKVFRQLRKRNVLWDGITDEEISTLAARLDTKPLDTWMQTDFAHISRLTVRDAAQMLVHLESIQSFLPGIQTRTDVQLVLHNLDALEQYTSIAELKESLIQSDKSWLFLAERMDLTPEFLEQHKAHIIDFLCNDGAYIVETYLNRLPGQQEESFLRVVKAELMGQLSELKYFEGDLQRELDSPLTALIKTAWSKNLCLERDHLEVREYDDFFSTMLLGVQPKRTCLSYIDGAYKNCLLSAFDSNKKILYVTLDGRIVGRAFLRLTKGRLTGTDPSAKEEFTFVDLENIKSTRPENHNGHKESERLTLFLERPYVSRVEPQTEQNILRMFIEFAERKADELDTQLILSAEYWSQARNMSGFTWTQYAIYISKSKAGAQYLDSLGGQATVSTEGSYSPGNFLVRREKGLAMAG